MDPVFNDTSTHLDHSVKPKANAPFNNDGQPTELIAEEPSSSSSTYAENGNGLSGGKTVVEYIEPGADDDYAMSLEFDDEEGAEDQDTTTRNQDSSFRNGGDVPSPMGHSNILPTSGEIDLTLVSDGSAQATLENFPTATSMSQNFLDTITPSSAMIEAAVANPQENGPQAQPNGIEHFDTLSGGVDFQSLLDNISPSTATAPSAEGITVAATGSSAVSSNAPRPESAQSPTTATLPPHANLPPRPPPQEKPATHPNYTPGDDIRSYHPHTQTPTAPPTFPPQQNNSFRPSHGLSVPLVAAGAPGTASAPNGLPPPPIATFQQLPPPIVQQQQQQQQVPLVQPLRQREKFERRLSRSVNSDGDDEDQEPWGPDIQKKYDEFLHDERVYVTEGQWDRFPLNSRLFIGNLPTEKVTKRDLFHIFHKHGKLAQVSIKQAYGFVQFLDSGCCYRALQTEQGQSVRGRKMHLEISKPQKNTRNATDAGVARPGMSRRSRSPDYGRRVPSPRGENRRDSRFPGGRADRGVEPRGTVSGRERDHRDKGYGRDDYRPIRSPSPRGFRGRDEYRNGRDRDRTPDRYDGRRRSRSRSPYGRNAPSSRYRSRSPRASNTDEDDELPLPKRAPRDVPDVQIIVMDDIDREFIAYIERSFRDRGVRPDVLYLNGRLSLAAVLRRQILEGVQAVVKLDRQTQHTGKIPLQVFDRRGGVDNVRFDEYDNLDANIAVELVLRAKQTHGAPDLPQYSASQHNYREPQFQYGPPPVQQQPPPQAPAAAAPPNIANLITSLDGPALQKLLGALSQSPQALQPPPPQQQQHQHQHQMQQPPQNVLGSDLASLLSGAAHQPQHQSYQHQQAPPPQANPYAALTSNPAFAANPGLASLLAGAVNNRPQHSSLPTQQQAQPAQQVQSIMDQLAKWKQ
ncbi:MAG: hypothetical protein M1827_000033 [Pycnora praestabilis]|nr:MAG: hypothetical protein M1827_000033 [Pycnora praestabilis]